MGTSDPVTYPQQRKLLGAASSKVDICMEWFIVQESLSLAVIGEIIFQLIFLFQQKTEKKDMADNTFNWQYWKIWSSFNYHPA